MRSAFLIVYNPFPFYLSEKEKEKHYQKTTRSIISNLYSHPNIPFSIYFSKYELTWLQEKHPEIFDILNELSNQRKQLEFLGGAAYEPFLSFISSSDRLGQIESNTIYLREKFGKKPKGAFLPHGIWEPSFVAYLKGDFDYTFLPNTLLEENGIDKKDMDYLYSEDDGKNILVFPYFNIKNNENFFETTPLVYLNHLTIYFEGSNIEQLNYVLQNIKSHGFELMLPSVFINKRKPNKTGNLQYFCPSKSNHLDKDNLNNQSTYYKQWIFSHKVSHLLYSRMLYTLLLIKHAKIEKRIKKLVLDLLWQSQSNQLYWPSLHGGINLPEAREWGYSQLLQIDNILRGAGVINFGILKGDFKLEGSNEVCYQGLKYNAFIQNTGAILYELDFLEREKNYLNFYNNENKNDAPRAFIDYICSEEEISKWPNNDKNINNLSLSYYENNDLNREYNYANYIIDKIIDNTRVKIEKKYNFTPSKIIIEYNLTNKGVNFLNKIFACELNLSIAEDNKFLIDGNILKNDSMTDVSKIEIIDQKETKIELTSDKKISIVRKKSYNNFNKNNIYQGESLLLSLPIALNFNEETKLILTLTIEQYENNL